MSWKIIPNLLTTLRVILIVPILAALLMTQNQLAFYLFIIAGISDCLDGLLARRFQWTSRYGAIIDPLADKLLLMSSFITLGYLGHLPYWLVAVVIGRDIWIVCGAFAYHFMIDHPDFSPSHLSKYNTFFQLLLIGLLLFHLSNPNLLSPQVLQFFILIVFIMSILSFIDYTWIWGRRAWRIKVEQANNL
jgi:cardiolipin synthase (CMP-forming)